MPGQVFGYDEEPTTEEMKEYHRLWIEHGRLSREFQMRKDWEYHTVNRGE